MAEKDFYMPPEEHLGAYKENDITILDPKHMRSKKEDVALDPSHDQGVYGEGPGAVGWAL
jgi:hypothetical protein